MSELSNSQLAKIAEEMGLDVIARSYGDTGGSAPSVSGQPAPAMPQMPQRAPSLSQMTVRPPMPNTRVMDMDDGERAWLAQRLREYAQGGMQGPMPHGQPLGQMDHAGKTDMARRMRERAQTMR